MAYSLLDLVRVEHILVGVEAATAEEAIRKVAQPLVATGNVTPEFADDVWKREEAYPTGLPTQPRATALPHADPDHVNQSAIGVGVLRSTVRFRQMGAGSAVTVDAHVVFLLAIKELEKQVEMIQQLVKLIQSGAVLEGVATASTPAIALARIRAGLLAAPPEKAASGSVPSDTGGS